MSRAAAIRRRDSRAGTDC